jgi:hypothetical protein
MALPPACSISATVSANVPGTSFCVLERMLVAAFSIERAVTTTVAPAEAKRWAIARPIPRLAPVTRATFPLRDGVSAMIYSPEERPLTGKTLLRRFVTATMIPITTPEFLASQKQGTGE